MSAIARATMFGAAGAAALTLLGGTAGAVPRDIEITAPVEAPGVRVEYVTHRDLNLTMAAHRKALRSRVSRAVGRVCEPYEPTTAGFEYSNCRHFAWKGANPQIDAAILRAQQLAASGNSTVPTAAIAIVGRR